MNYIFGTGPLGMAVLRELLNRGQKVKVINRTGKADIPQGVELIKGDARDRNFTKEICKDAEKIFHCAGLPYTEWSDHLPSMMNGLIEAAAFSGAKIIYADNLYAYGPVNGDYHEDLSYKPVGVKTKVRAQVAENLLNNHQQGKIKAVIGRGPDFFGPRALVATLGSRVIGNLLLGKKAEAIGNIDLPHTHIFIEDFARGLVTLSENDRSLGQVWHIPAAPTISTRELIEMVGDEIGKKPTYRLASSQIVNFLGLFDKNMREFKEMMYMFNKPFIVSHAKFAKAFPYQVTEHREAIRKTVAWFRNIMGSGRV